jgi:hypothetical protein
MKRSDLLALLVVLQYLVCLGDLLKLPLGGLVVFVKIRVVLLGQLAELLLDLVFRGALTHAQHLVVVCAVRKMCHHTNTTLDDP